MMNNDKKDHNCTNIGQEVKDPTLQKGKINMSFLFLLIVFQNLSKKVLVMEKIAIFILRNIIDGRILRLRYF